MEYYVYLPEEYGRIEGQRLKNKSFTSSEVRAYGSEIDDVKETAEVEEDKETAELQSLMKVIPDEEEVAVAAIPLATKPLSIVDWKILKEGKISYNQIIRADGSSKSLYVFMLVEKRYPLTPTTITEMLNKKLQADHWNEMCYQLLKLIIKQLKNQ
ncbi:hypothetical protein Tco_0589325 [Tanacetum coccineum]